MLTRVDVSHRLFTVLFKIFKCKGFVLPMEQAVVVDGREASVTYTFKSHTKPNLT